MASDPSAIGVTDGAFFVSKSELLDWLRTDFQINISKVEECGNGNSNEQSGILVLNDVS